MTDKQLEQEEEVRISPRTGKPIDQRYAHRRKNAHKPHKKSPVIGMNGYDLEDGDTAKYLSLNPRTGKPIDQRYAHRRKNAHKPHKKSPVIGMNGYDLEDGDTAKYLSLNMELFNMVEIDKYDPEAVAKRLEEYFNLHVKYDMKPTVAGMAMALGMNRRTLIGIVNDYAIGGNGYKTSLPRSVTLIIKKAYFILENLWMALGMNRRTLIGIVNDYAIGGNGYKTSLPRSVTLIIKKAYFILENLWENYTTSGKLNPVTAIFLAKNNFHYQDKVEHVVAPEVDQDTIDVEAIKQRYIEDK